MSSDPVATRGTTNSGKWVILAVLLFAIACTSFEWVYMKMHRAPFIPLREAVTETFGRKAQVKVEGGRNKRGPMTLRVVIDVPFDPLSKKPEEEQKTRETIGTLEDLIRKHVADLKDYEVLQIYLVQIVPEGTPLRKEYTRAIKDVIAGG